MFLNVIRKGARLGGIPKIEPADRPLKPPKRSIQSSNHAYQSEKQRIQVQVKKEEKPR
jgi:hypothetical protein